LKEKTRYPPYPGDRARRSLRLALAINKSFRPAMSQGRKRRRERRREEGREGGRKEGRKEEKKGKEREKEFVEG
jgi:hypothetical protein